MNFLSYIWEHLHFSQRAACSAQPFSFLIQNKYSLFVTLYLIGWASITLHPVFFRLSTLLLAHTPKSVSKVVFGKRSNWQGLFFFYLPSHTHTHTHTHVRVSSVSNTKKTFSRKCEMSRKGEVKVETWSGLTSSSMVLKYD